MWSQPRVNNTHSTTITPTSEGCVLFFLFHRDYLHTLSSVPSIRVIKVQFAFHLPTIFSISSCRGGFVYLTFLTLPSQFNIKQLLGDRRKGWKINCSTKLRGRFPPSRVNRGKVVKNQLYGFQQDLAPPPTKPHQSCNLPESEKDSPRELKFKCSVRRRCQDHVTPKPNKRFCHVLSVALRFTHHWGSAWQPGGAQITSAAMLVCPFDGALQRDTASTRGVHTTCVCYLTGTAW